MHIFAAMNNQKNWFKTDKNVNMNLSFKQFAQFVPASMATKKTAPISFKPTNAILVFLLLKQ